MAHLCNHAWLGEGFNKLQCVLSGLQGVAGGGFGSEAYEAAAASLEDVGLTEKANTPAAALSGGMKRKLQACLMYPFTPPPPFLPEALSEGLSQIRVPHCTIMLSACLDTPPPPYAIHPILIFTASPSQV